MCPPKIDSAISQQQKLQANNPQAPNPPASIPPSQNPPQMNQNQQLKPKPKTQVEILLQYEHEKGISVKQKRHQIELMQKYEKERPKILKKQIDKQNALARRIKCLNPSCQLTFARLSLMRMHVAQEHKQLADRSGILLYECNLCNLYSTLNERVLQKHQVSCARLQRALLEARGELEEEEEALNTEEELEFQRAQKFN